MSVARPVCAAPPLSDELLDKYDSMINDPSLTSAQADSLRVLMKCVRKWWELPESTGEKKAVGNLTVVQKMDRKVMDELWDLIPWPDELSMFASRLEEIQKDNAAAHGIDVEMWISKVNKTIILKNFSSLDRFYNLSEAMKSKTSWKAILPESVMADVEKEFEKVLSCKKEIAACITAKNCDGLPYPKAVGTELRNMAMHLLWYVMEMNLDREPMYAGAK